MEWLGSILLSLCAVPLAWEAYKDKTIDINPWFFHAWFWGEVLLMASYWHEPALALNYSINIGCLLVVWRYK